MALQISPLSDTLGAEATGVDLSGSISDADQEALHQAILDNLVLVIRDQHLTSPEYLAAVRLFGETMEQQLSTFLLDDHPEIAVLDSSTSELDEDGNPFPVGSRAWHSDHTNHAEPPKMTALRAIQLPKSGGGDTGFANMHSAYDALSAPRKSALDTLKTVNKIEDKAYVSDEARAKFGALQSHPLIRTHPETGKKAIYLHPGKVDHIEGMTPEDSKDFVDSLMEEIIQPDVVYRHVWRPGDLTIWDNRAVLHIAHRGYDHTEQRLMHRVLIKGDRPH